MPTQDHFIDVPLHTGIDVKRDEFTGQAPAAREQKNTNFADEIGGTPPMPGHLELNTPTLDAGGEATGISTGNDAIALHTSYGRAQLFNKATNLWQDNLVSTYAPNLEISSDFILSGRAGIVAISACHTAGYSLYAYEERGNAGSIRYVIRSGESNIGPFDVPEPGGAPAKPFRDFMCVSTPTRTFLYLVYDTGGVQQDELLILEVAPDGTTTSASVGGFLWPETVRLCAVPDGSDPENVHWLVINSINQAYKVNPNTAALLADVNLIPSTSPPDWSDVFVDYDAGNVWVAALTSDQATISVYAFDTATETVRNQTLAVTTPALQYNRISCHAGRFLGGMISSTGAGASQVQAFFASNLDPTTFTLTLCNEVHNMQQVGSGIVDEHGNQIYPLTFQLTVAQADADGSGDRYPIDPAIVGYQLENSSFNADNECALHPVARWGVDTVRTNYAKTRESLPYAGYPTEVGQKQGKTLVDIDLKHRRWMHEVNLGRGASALGTGIPWAFDGHRFMPQCFLWRPFIEDVVFDNGGNAPAGTYEYKAQFIWEDDTGHIMRSADSPAFIAVAGSGSQMATITVLTHQPPHRDDSATGLIRCWLYATQPNGADFYRLNDSTGREALEGVYDEATNTFAFTDIEDPFPPTDDGTATGNPVTALLTFAATPPELAPECPNGFWDTEVVSQRVWGIDAEDRDILWLSKNLVLLRTPEFNALLKLRVPEEDGVCIGLSAHNGYLVIFKRNTIWVLQDLEGPGNILGQGVPLPKPTKIARVGCRDRRSTVSFPGGVLFHTGRHLMMFNGGSVQSFGEQVQPIVVDSVVYMDHVPLRNELHLNVVPDDGGTQRHLVYNYDIATWHEWTDHEFFDVVRIEDSELFLHDVNGQCLQLPIQLSPDALGLLRQKPDRVVTTQFIRPGPHTAARKVREVIVEFALPDTTLDEGDSVTITLTSNHQTPEPPRVWNDAEIEALRGTSDRFQLRVLPITQLDSLRVSVITESQQALNAIHATIVFGIEEGTERLYPEGATK